MEDIENVDQSAYIQQFEEYQAKKKEQEEEAARAHQERMKKMREALAARGIKKGANPKAPISKAPTVAEIESPNPPVEFQAEIK